MSTRPDESAQETQGHAVTEAPFATPWGPGKASVRRGRLVEVELPPVTATTACGPAVTQAPSDLEVLRRWVNELEAYFHGEKLCWEVGELEPELEGLSPFARSIVCALLVVPAGETVGYGELADMAGHPRAGRAVGSVMASNAIPIVVPCHRVIRSDGSLGRYGTDASWKARLLDHERGNVRGG